MKKHDLITVILFLSLTVGVGTAFWLLPDRDMSPEENRMLTTLPTLSLEDWLSGRLSTELTRYYADQTPLRRAWVGLHAPTELILGRGESNGVLLGADGQLAVRRHDMYVSRTERASDTDIYRPAHVEAGLEALVRLDETLAAAGIPLTVLLPPRTVDVVADDLTYPSALSDALDATIREGLADIHHIDLLPELRARHAAGEYVYFRTDHHWTQRGAYAAYAALMSSLGMSEEILPPAYFTVRTVPDFYGTTHARAGMYHIPPDTLEIFEASDGSDALFEVRDEHGKTVTDAGFISEKYLSGKDKYGAFLDGTHRLLTVSMTVSMTVAGTVGDSPAEESSRPRLLLARDSFGACMVPFLARHFDIVTVNLTGGMTDLSALAAEYGCNRVLVVCNRENLLTSDCIVSLH